MTRSPWAPPQPWRLRLRRRIGATRPGHALRKISWLARRAARALPARPVRMPAAARPSRVRNVLLISPTDFTGNTALHVHAIASGLVREGFAPVIAVPGNVESVDDVGRPPFPVITFREARTRLAFPDTRGPDLLHAFTPRRGVRRLTLELVTRHRCPYLLHLEDNEELVTRAADGEATEFTAGAIGVTVVVERLLELVPQNVPQTIVWPGFDEAVLAPQRGRDAVRAELRVEDALVLVYNGNVHGANVQELGSLYRAVADLRRGGRRVVLVRTGWNFVPRSHLPQLGEGLIELGWVSRRHVPDLLAAADVLVQPGRPGHFNDYRFPSKVPEFLASGRPVVLPRTNIGLHLRDGEEALLLERGDAAEIAAKVELLAGDPALRARIGDCGRAFALRELRWERAVAAVRSLYRTIAT